jgi:hypothetical protein
MRGMTVRVTLVMLALLAVLYLPTSTAGHKRLRSSIWRRPLQGPKPLQIMRRLRPTTTGRPPLRKRRRRSTVG